jgi:hypothetical protein
MHGFVRLQRGTQEKPEYVEMPLPEAGMALTITRPFFPQQDDYSADHRNERQ